MIELQQARFFVTLAEELNFSRAARRLNISQPPLSRHIQQLEYLLGVKLFERTSRRVVLTPAGVTFHAEARLLLQQADAAVVAVRRAARALEGALTIGFVGAATYDYLPRMIKAATAELPSISLDLVQMESVEQQEALLAGSIDLALSRPLNGPASIDQMTVAIDELILAIPNQHPLAVRRRPPLRSLNGEPFIMFAPAARYLHDMLTDMFAQHAITPRVVQQLTHSQSILSLVSVGIGLAIVPQAAKKACFDNVTFRNLDISRDTRAELHASWSRDNQNSALPALRSVLARLPILRFD